MAAGQELAVMRAAVQQEADHLRAEVGQLRRRLEVLATVERTIATQPPVAALEALRAWLAPPDGTAGSVCAAGSGSGAPPAAVAVAELFTLEAIVGMFARLADAVAVSLAEANPVIPEANPVELLLEVPVALEAHDERPTVTPAAPSPSPPRLTRARRGELAATVYGFLALAPSGMLPSTLALRLNRPVENVWAALLVLEHRRLVTREGKRFLVRRAAPAPAEIPAPPLRLVRYGDTEFEVVPPPRPSPLLGSSITPTAIGETR